jgi:hypothetical protein
MDKEAIMDWIVMLGILLLSLIPITLFHIAMEKSNG